MRSYTKNTSAKPILHADQQTAEKKMHLKNRKLKQRQMFVCSEWMAMGKTIGSMDKGEALAEWHPLNWQVFILFFADQ